MLRVDAVTVCVGFADFLVETLPYTLAFADSVTVVTNQADSATQKLATRLGAKLLLSEEGGATFNKGKLVDRGLQTLGSPSWRLHVDADTALPTDSRRRLELLDPDETCIYGCDRVTVQGAEAWDALVASGYMLGAAGDTVNLVRFPCRVGSRWVSFRAGWAPLGFFQLWHSSQEVVDGQRNLKQYPTDSPDAQHSDWRFALQWDRRRRTLIPEIVAVHLDSAEKHTGANWQGRSTPPFRNEIQGSSS